MNRVPVASWGVLEDRKPAYALIGEIDLVVVRYDDEVSVLYGRCLHRGALMADGFVEGRNLICGVHAWDYRLETGVSEYDNREVLQKFESWIEDGQVWVDQDEVEAWGRDHPQPYDRAAYQGEFQDPKSLFPEPASMPNFGTKWKWLNHYAWYSSFFASTT